MTSAHKRVNWTTAMLEYVEDPTSTYRSIAAKYGASRRAVEWHAQREGWAAERESYCGKVAEKLVEHGSSDAAEILYKRNMEQLRQNEELRRMLKSLLAGKLAVPRIDMMRAISAFDVLYRMDRLIMGADVMPVTAPRDRFAEMTDEELQEELFRTRKAGLDAMDDDELAKLGVQRKKPKV